MLPPYQMALPERRQFCLEMSNCSDVKAAKDPFLPVTTPMIDRCNFPLPPLSIYCPQYQYREMCKSDIWSYYALSFYMKEERLQQELCHQYEQEFKPLH